MGIKKVPKVKELSQEFSTLLAQKKQDYAELQKACEEARRLQIYKANAELLLQMKKSEQEKSREHQQEK